MHMLYIMTGPYLCTGLNRACCFNQLALPLAPAKVPQAINRTRNCVNISLQWLWDGIVKAGDI